MTSRRSRRALLVVLCCLLARPALAQEPPASLPDDAARTARARALFRQGADLARQSRWRDAVEAFEESARLRPHAATSYNLGFSERALGRATRAWRWFSMALAQHGTSRRDELDAAVAADAQRYLEEAEARVARVRLTVGPADARLAVDGRPLEQLVRPGGPVLLAGTRDPGAGERAPAPAFEVWLDPGSHVLVLSRPGVPDVVVSETFAPGSRRALALRLAAPPPATRAAPAAPPARPAAPGHTSSRSRRGWTLALAGVGVATLAAGTGLGLWARSTWADAKAACPARTACPDDRGAQLSRDALLRGNLATAAFVVGGAALAGAGAVFFFLRPRAVEARRLSLAPAVGPGGAGLLLVGEYQ